MTVSGTLIQSNYSSLILLTQVTMGTFQYSTSGSSKFGTGEQQDISLKVKLLIASLTYFLNINFNFYALITKNKNNNIIESIYLSDSKF